MNNISFFTLFTFFTSLSAFSQVQFSSVIELGIAGTSKFDTGNNTETVMPLLSGNFGCLLRYSLSEQIGIHSGLLINNINYRQQVQTENPDPSNIYSTGPTTVLRNYHLIQIYLPLGLDLKFGKFDYSIGIRSGISVFQKYNQYVTGEILYEPYDVTIKKNPLNVSVFRFDGFASISRKLNPKLSLSLSGYHSIFKIKFKSGSPGFYNYQVGIGLNYYFE